MQSAGPAPIGAVFAALARQAVAAAIVTTAAAALYAGNVAAGLRETAAMRGTVALAGVYAPVTILRDRRDVPHIVARNEHDAFFAQGYAEGSDRLFQLDLTRRYAYGQLAEVLGARALALDRAQRAVDVARIAARQLRGLAQPDRASVVAFAEGINAAAAAQPLPVEFRVLLYRPAPWTPQDSVAVSIVASLELSDSWHDVFARDAIWRRHGARCYDRIAPLSDSRYDVTARSNFDPGAARAALDCDDPQFAEVPQRHRVGSNAWAIGAQRSTDAHALIANDPHLDVTIPGIWYLVDLHAPELHVAGATIPGFPGIVLGHNEALAWAATNAEMATTTVFRAGRLRGGSWVRERFHVRFARDVTAEYYRTPREFSVPDDNDASAFALVRWPVYVQTHSTIATALRLDRAQDVHAALRVLAGYRGSPQNFVLADRRGEVAYHVVGLVPNDPAWGRYVHASVDLGKTFAPIAFALLPNEAPSRSATFVTANNKAYGPRYPYRLSAQFEPPYRAYRIAQLLHARARYDATGFARMQLDTYSPIDRAIVTAAARFALAHPLEDANGSALRLLEGWNGRFDGGSRAASLAHALRLALYGPAPVFGAPANGSDFREALLVALDERRPWGDAGGVRIEHPLAPLHLGFLNGAWLPGEGDAYTIRLQEPGFAQGFRAVWDAGDWDRGGIAIPSGESGEPGSPHYTDLTPAWVAGTLAPLPFSDAAVRKATAEVLTLRPR